MKTEMKVCLAAAICLMVIGHASAALAGGLSISPLRALLSPDVRIAEFNVVSSEPAPTLMQVRLFAWTQVNGVDQLTPSDNLVVGPPIFTLRPEKTQLIRVGLRNLGTLTREAAYRIVIAEVPTAPRPGLNFAFRLSMPIFVSPAMPTGPKALWSADQIDASHLRITLTNVGDQHLRIETLRIANARGAAPFYTSTQAIYVLSGQPRSWVIPLDEARSVQVLHVEGSLDGREIDQSVNVNAP